MARTKTFAKKNGKRSKKSKTGKTGRKSAPAKGGVQERKKNRYRPGTVALRMIKKY